MVNTPKITMLQYQVVLIRNTARISLSWNACFSSLAALM